MMARDHDGDCNSDVDSNRRHKRQKTRSRSPRYSGPSDRRSGHSTGRHDRVRSRSPHRRHRGHRKNKKQNELLPSATSSAIPRTVVLPFKAQPLDQYDSFKEYQALFALYLDVQKQLDISDLDDREIKGRWKSFVKKWNTGELAEGWYDPVVKHKADTAARDEEETRKPNEIKSKHRPSSNIPSPAEPNSDSEDEFGPSLPTQSILTSKTTTLTIANGPTIPSLQDLALRDELISQKSRSNYLSEQASRREERKAERSLNKARLDELVPRSDAGTRERQLENARERATVQKSLQDAKDGGVEEINDNDLLGDGGNDGIEGYKKRKAEEERKKSERAIRREEIERARMEERRLRVQERKEKEEKTVNMLKDLARARFG